MSFVLFNSMYNLKTNSWEYDDEIVRLRQEKKAAIDLQKHKHDDWNDNYELYRNKVRTNRLTQRQAVNIPLMKETVKTLLSKIDDPPTVDWKENSGDDMKELIYQEMWDQSSVDNKLELIDILDKKNVLLYGLSTKKLNIGDKGVEVTVEDTFDVLLDPLMKTGDVETARFIIFHNILRTVREILADERYDKKGKDELKIWADSAPGIIQSGITSEELTKKMERLEAMGVESDKFSIFAGGDRLVNLTEHFTTKWNDKKKKFERKVIVYAEDMIMLRDVTLDEALGVDFWPCVIWSEDPETNDVYPDSVADLVRTPNKVVNIWYSQLVENRTLKNFQMHWYLPMQGYEPQTYTPGPGVMLPAPPGDNINNVIKPVEISGLDDTLTAINAITNIVERGTGATAIDKGQSEKSAQTLGEVEILVGKAQERAISMTKFYRLAWTELAEKWSALMHANAPKFIKLNKEGASGKIYPKKVFRSDWESTNGYTPIVRSSSETEQSDVDSMKKWLFVMSQDPENAALREIGLSRQLGLLDVTPEELRRIEEGGKKQQDALEQPMEQETPDNPQLQNDIQNKLALLTQ